MKKLVVFVSIIAAVSATRRLDGAFPALPDQIFVQQNNTIPYSTAELFHNLGENKTCRVGVSYNTNGTKSTIMLSSLISAISTSPAYSRQYYFPLDNQTTTNVQLSCDGAAMTWVTADKNNSQSWIIFASEHPAMAGAVNSQFTEFTSAATGFFPTYFSEMADTMGAYLVHENKTVDLSKHYVVGVAVMQFTSIVFTFNDGSNVTSPIDQAFADGERVVFWLTHEKNVTVTKLMGAGQSAGRFTIVNGVTSDAQLTVAGSRKSLKGDVTDFTASVGYGESKVVHFEQGEVLSGMTWWFNESDKKDLDTQAFESTLTWGTGVVLAGFNATLVAAGPEVDNLKQVIFLEDVDEVKAALDAGVKGIVRFANALAVEATLVYAYNETTPPQHAVRRILRPQAETTFELTQGQSQTVSIPKAATQFEVSWMDKDNKEINGKVDVLHEASLRPEALAFNVFTIGNPNSPNASYKPKQVTTYDAPAPQPPAPAPAEESNFWSQPWPYIVIAAFVLVVFGGGFYFYKKHQDNAGSEGKPLLG